MLRFAGRDRVPHCGLTLLVVVWLAACGSAPPPDPELARLQERAQRVVDEIGYNTVRPHSSLGYMSPVVFAEQAA